MVHRAGPYTRRDPEGDRVSRKQLMILAAMGAMAAFIAWLAWSSRQPPMLPDDDTHRTFLGARECLSCHCPEGPVPRSRQHPLGDDCVRCHGSR